MSQPPYLISVPPASLITDEYDTGRAAYGGGGGTAPPSSRDPSPPRPSASRLSALRMEEAALGQGGGGGGVPRLAPWELGQQLQASLLKYEELGNMELEVEQLHQARAVAAAQQAAQQVRERETITHPISSLPPTWHLTHDL